MFVKFVFIYAVFSMMYSKLNEVDSAYVLMVDTFVEIASVFALLVKRFLSKSPKFYAISDAFSEILL